MIPKETTLEILQLEGRDHALHWRGEELGGRGHTKRRMRDHTNEPVTG